MECGNVKPIRGNYDQFNHPGPKVVEVTPAKFRKTLASLGLTQSEAARKMNVHRIKVWRWYHGKHRIPGEVTALLECWKEHHLP